MAFMNIVMPQKRTFILTTWTLWGIRYLWWRYEQCLFHHHHHFIINEEREKFQFYLAFAYILFIPFIFLVSSITFADRICKQISLKFKKSMEQSHHTHQINSERKEVTGFNVNNHQFRFLNSTWHYSITPCLPFVYILWVWLYNFIYLLCKQLNNKNLVFALLHLCCYVWTEFIVAPYLLPPSLNKTNE